MKDALGDALEGQEGGGEWRSSSSWDVEFLVKFRKPSTWGDAPRGWRAKAKTKAKGIMAMAGQTVTRGRKETTKVGYLGVGDINDMI